MALIYRVFNTTQPKYGYNHRGARGAAKDFYERLSPDLAEWTSLSLIEKNIRQLENCQEASLGIITVRAERLRE